MRAALQAAMMMLCLPMLASGQEKPPKPPVGFASAKQLGEWMSGYYRKPSPDRVVASIRYKEKTGLLESNRGAIAPNIGFYSRVFRKHPEQTAAWYAQLKGVKGATLAMLWQAIWFSNTPAAKQVLGEVTAEGHPAQLQALLAMLKSRAAPDPLQIPLRHASVLDLLWGSFLATGEAPYVKRIISALALMKAAGGDQMTVMIGQAARWSLTSNGRQHRRVLEILKQSVEGQPASIKATLQQIIASIESKGPARPKPDVVHKDPKVRQSISNLKQLGLGLILYRDNHGKGSRYPPLTRMLSTLYTAGTIVEPGLFACPRTGRTPTAEELKGHQADKLGYLATPYPIRSQRRASQRAVVWDRGHQGIRLVLFLDGHVEVLDEERFQLLLAALKAREAQLKAQGAEPRHMPDRPASGGQGK